MWNRDPVAGGTVPAEAGAAIRSSRDKAPEVCCPSAWSSCPACISNL
ncbi:hypothetical protein GCM10009767_14890 [Kocuria aegyptia]|uniref:Uncharacterized protein n=1 Tax=Kocuria aegyptia TaxID=330943 RepID=A0ABN2KHU3_9MICC